ncbi:MAG: 6-pyruvoyltetrahydropterin/6-carboxytetrahydropterin synthase [Actinomycetota bacterium]|jgi:6-pyruvoyltetrahydropterin/6-carboxytetrahydropterin synthase|nr:6-pyruvoyltetrahydropterin/6-carboxytetrahydropterin synthase [Actinomycetota bacterium]
MRTSVTRVFGFEAAHQLPWHEGKCRNLHGHSYRLEVTVEGLIDEHGIVVDFADVKKVVDQEIVDRYDHRYLNDLIDNPTAENLAHEIWKTVEAAGMDVSRIRLWETADSFVEVVR